ncbi:centrosomal protein 15 isoform X2 [Hoplias malabaricus]|uniref:centrosomal protein 15 isoform X2 n=1 Tax=Hoplias malabaricus TaxID=27720 RepID=UPI0034636528
MDTNPQDEIQLSKKHEEILGRRAVLLQQMEMCYEQQKAKKKQQAMISEAAHERNMTVLEDLQKVEHCLQSRALPHPDVIKLQTCYWASVEQKLPEWETYLLGKGPAPVTEMERSRGLHRPKGTRQDSSPARDKGRPPRPKPSSQHSSKESDAPVTTKPLDAPNSAQSGKNLPIHS